MTSQKPHKSTNTYTDLIFGSHMVVHFGNSHHNLKRNNRKTNFDKFAQFLLVEQTVVQNRCCFVCCRKLSKPPSWYQISFSCPLLCYTDSILLFRHRLHFTSENIVLLRIFHDTFGILFACNVYNACKVPI